VSPLLRSLARTFLGIVTPGFATRCTTGPIWGAKIFALRLGDGLLGDTGLKKLFLRTLLICSNYSQECRANGCLNSRERINITCGASYALMSTLLLCTSPGTGYTKQAFVVSPTYFLAAGVFEGSSFPQLVSETLCL